MKAMILAAGVGSRLDPLTRSVPKPMVPVINLPVIEHIIHLLVKHGFREIYCNTHYLGDQIEKYFHSGSSQGAQIYFNREEELLGTAGGVKRVADTTDFFSSNEPFLVIGGDDLTNVDLTAMLAYHKEKKSLATLALTEVEDPSQFGVVVLEEDGHIAQFVEKPAPGTEPSNLVNMGVYLFEPEILELIPSGQFYDFGKELFPLLQEQKKPFYGFKNDAYWRDVGNLREYRDCQNDFFDDSTLFQIDLPQTSPGLWIAEDAQIHPDAKIEAPCVIGARAVIGANARITDRSVIGEDVTIGENATVSNSVLWARSSVGENTHLERCIVGLDSSIQSNAGVFDAAIILADQTE